MKLSYVKDGVPYVVTKGTGCGTLRKGDRVRMSSGDLVCVEAEGWLKKGSWEGLGATVEVDKEAITENIKKLEGEKADLMTMLGVDTEKE